MSNKPSTTKSKDSALKEAFRNFNWRLALTLFVSCIVIIGLYFYLGYGINVTVGNITTLVYMIVGSLMILAYFIINRAFTGRGVTYEMLPDTMSHKEKEEYLCDVANRERKSRWMLIVIFPVVIALLCDMFYLFVIEEFLLK